MAKATFKEVLTIDAISRIRRFYPYAASLLAYVTVERVLKTYVLDNRKDPYYARHLLPPKKILKSHASKALSSTAGLSDSKFIRDILCFLTLGDVEEILKCRRRIARDRNEAMHSNLYIRNESKLNQPARIAKNKKRLRKALSHLKWTMANFTDYRLCDKSGHLKIENAHGIRP